MTLHIEKPVAKPAAPPFRERRGLPAAPPIRLAHIVSVSGSHAVAVAASEAPAPAVAVRSTSTPVIAARFSSAPSIPSQLPAGSSPGMKMFVPAPAPPVSIAKSSDTPAVIAKPGMAQPAGSHATPVISTASAAAGTPAAPAPAIPKSEPPAAVAAVATVATSKPADNPPASAPRTVPALPKPDAPPASSDMPDGPITIKKAIVPSRQEVSDTLKDHPGAAVLSDQHPHSQELVDGHSVQLR